MLVTERMQALGDHARSSRQPSLKERKHAKADESAAKDDVIVEDKLETAEESPAATIVDSAAVQPPAHENVGNGAAEPQTAREDEDLSAAKHAIIHEWQNWSALHSDELSDPNVAEYFFRHLETKKSHLLNFGLKDIQLLISRDVRP